jgi:hypothetical protein
MPQPQIPERAVTELTLRELRDLVGGIQETLWKQTLNAGTDSPDDFWSADKEWSWDTLDFIAAALEGHGLKPVNLPTVVGFESVDDFLNHLVEGSISGDPPAGNYDDEREEDPT